MLRRLYDWTLRLADTPYALAALAVVSFVESSIFPIPPDVLLIPMILAAPTRAWRIAAVCTAASVLGGFAGYAIGAFLFEELGKPALEFYGKMDSFDEIARRFNEIGPQAVLFAAMTPFPYKVVTIFSGAVGLNLPGFGLASLVGRGLRFFLIAWLLRRYGEVIRDFIEKRLGLVAAGALILLFGGFWLARTL